MAKAITHIEKAAPNPAVEQAQAIGQILQAVTANREAILVFLDILNELNKMGLLEAVQNMLKNKHDISLIALNQLNKPGAQHILKNGMNALAFLSSIEPSELQTMLGGLSAGIKQAGRQDSEHKQVGMWGMMKSLRDPEIGASMSMLLNFLHGMGTELRKDVH